MFNWIKDFFKRLSILVNKRLQKANASWIDDLQKEIKSLQVSLNATIGIQNKHDERIAENKKDILFLDKCDDNAKDRLSSLFSKLAKIEETTVTKEELEGDLTKRANNTSNRLYQIEKKIDDFKENTRQNIAWLDDITEYLEQEVYSTIPRVNPRRLILQTSEISTTETREKTAAKFAIAELAKYMFFPVKKTKFNKAVYDKLKQHTESASRRKSRALVEELISDGWLTETQEVNIKWINVRG